MASEAIDRGDGSAGGPDPDRNNEPPGPGGRTIDEALRDLAVTLAETHRTLDALIERWERDSER